MSKFVNYEIACEGYDNNRVAAEFDVICALMQFYCRKHLKELHVLDAGCGTGNYTQALIEHGIGHVTLLDASPAMMEVAKNKMANDVEAGKIKGFVHAVLPTFPFRDENFDAVMFNLVLNHLDMTEGDHFPTCVQTLREARRTLKSGGIIVVSTVLKSTAANDIWSVQVDKSLGDKIIRSLPSLEQFEQMFNAAGITCKQKLTMLGTDIFPSYYTNPESHFSHFLDHVYATDTERKTAYQAMIKLKEKGEIQRWVKEHDKSRGFLTIFVCLAKETNEKETMKDE